MAETAIAPEAPQAAPEPSWEDRASAFAAENMDSPVAPKQQPQQRKAEPKAEPAPKPAEKAPEKAEAKPAEKPAEKAQDKPADKPAEKPAEAPKDAAKPAETPKPRAWEMFHKAEAEKKAIAKERDAYKAELESIRKQSPQNDPFEHPEVVKLKTRAQELEDTIKFVDYTKSTEFVDKYQKPYQDLAARLTAEATEFMVEGEDGSVRSLKSGEFWSVVTSHSAEDAYKAAKAIFPNDPAKVSDLLAKRKDIANSWRAMEEAKQDFKTKGAEREKMTQAEAQKKAKQEEARAIERAEKFNALAEGARADEKLKPYLTAPDDDPKAKELLTKGMNDAARAFGLGEDDTQMGEDEQLALHASVLNKAGSWNMLRYLNQKQSATIEELKKKLAEYEQSEPGDGQPQRGGGAQPEADDVDARMSRFIG